MIQNQSQEKIEITNSRFKWWVPETKTKVRQESFGVIRELQKIKKLKKQIFQFRKSLNESSIFPKPHFAPSKKQPPKQAPIRVLNLPHPAPSSHKLNIVLPKEIKNIQKKEKLERKKPSLTSRNKVMRKDQKVLFRQRSMVYEKELRKQVLGPIGPFLKSNAKAHTNDGSEERNNDTGEEIEGESHHVSKSLPHLEANLKNGGLKNFHLVKNSRNAEVQRKSQMRNLVYQSYAAQSSELKKFNIKLFQTSDTQKSKKFIFPKGFDRSSQNPRIFKALSSSPNSSYIKKSRNTQRAYNTLEYTNEKIPKILKISDLEKSYS